MARKKNHDVKVGVIGLLIGVILGSTLALTGSDEGSLEGWIFRRMRFDGNAERIDATRHGAAIRNALRIRRQ